MSNSVERIMVIGAGQMGTGIAQVAAMSGYTVTLHDMKMDLAEKGIKDIEKRLERDVAKERISESDLARFMRLIQPSDRIGNAEHADLIIEAAVESMEIKKNIFAQLDSFAPNHAVLATNTSSLAITELAAMTSRPDKVIGMHFMNPVPVMKLVEVIRGLQTSDSSFATVESVAKAMKKTPVEVNDFPGFVANRILMPMINEAIFAVYEGVSTPEDVDSVMELGMNHPMGPLTLADFIGLDTCLSIMEVLHSGFGDDKYRPCPLLRKYVNAGWLGKKSGRGFYVYD